MSDSAQQRGSESAKSRLAEASRTKDLSARLAWIIGICQGILLAVLAVALADYWLLLPVWARSVAAGGIALLAIFGLFRLVQFLRRPTAIKEAALDLEASKPELGCEISTAAEYLSGERQITREYEPEIVAALEAKAAAELRRTHIPYERRLVLPAVILALTGIAVLVFLFVAPTMLTALQRTVLPFSDAHYTKVQVEPGNVEIPLGSSLDITNTFTGRVPKEPQFHWRQDSTQPWQTAPLINQLGGGTYAYALREIRQNLQYRVTGGDAVSEIFEVQAYAPPEVKDLNVRIEAPSYTGRAPASQISPEITALRGSQVQIQVEPSTILSAAKLRFSGVAGEMPLVPGPGGLWTAQLTVTNETEYWIDLFDAKGRRGGSSKPHPIHALPDTPPTVVIQAPGQDMRATLTNRIPLRISVSDDYGVKDLKLVFHKLGEAEQVVPLTLSKSSAKQQMATAELDLAALDLKDFDVVAYHAEATDNNALDGPGSGKSPVYFVEITQLKAGLPNPQPPSPTLNLLALQKQIIADTASLDPRSPIEAFGTLAVRQTSAADFGQIYLRGLQASRAPAQAVDEMTSALSEMTSAASNLQAQKRDDALPAEERALAHLYQVLKQMPELEDLPTEPKRSTNAPPSNTLAIVLGAIREKRQLPPAEAQSLQEALEQAEALADAQAALNAALQEAQRSGGSAEDSQPPTPGDQEQAQGGNQAQAQGQQAPQGQGQAQAQGQAQGRGQGKGRGQGQGQGKGKGQKQGEAERQELAENKNEPKDQPPGDTPDQDKGAEDQLANATQNERAPQDEPDAPGENSGKGKAAGQAQANGEGGGEGDAPGRGEPKTNSAPGERGTESQPPGAKDLAQREADLQKQAAELAAQLEKLSGKEARVARNAGQNARLGSHKIAQALAEIRKGRFGAAGVYGFQGELALREVVAQLQKAARARPELTDSAEEDAPKEFEGLISEYFKRLSHAE